MKVIIQIFALFIISISGFAQSNLSIRLKENYGMDARIDSRTSQANLNFGNSQNLGIWAWTLSGGVSINRTLLSFPITEIPSDAIIQQATLRLFYDSLSPFTMGQSGLNDFSVRRVISPWKEDSVTWVNQPNVTNLNQRNSFFSINNASPNIEMNVTNLLNAARDVDSNSLDLMLQLNTEQIFRSIILASSEHPDSTLRPRLDITYGLPNIQLVRPTILDSHEMNKPLIIEWNALGINAVSIDYSLGDTNWINIVENIPSKSVNNIFQWIPTFTANACKIRVRSYQNLNIFDFSDKWFKIYDGPMLNYISPTAGSVLYPGDSIRIKWSNQKVPFVKIFFKIGSGQLQLIDSNVLGSLENYFWQVPNYISDSVFIVIQAQEMPWVAAQNNLPFKISQFPSFKLKDPNQETQWLAGSTQQIRWSVLNSNYSRLYYAPEDGIWQTIKDSIWMDSSYSWNIPKTLIGKIKLRVSDPKQKVFGDTTAFFINVVEPIVLDTPKIAIIYPLGGEIFETGSNLTIQWDAKSIDSVQLSYKTNTQTWQIISPLIPAILKQYLFLLPNEPFSEFNLKIKGFKDTIQIIDSLSNPFSTEKRTGLITISTSGIHVYPNPLQDDYLNIHVNEIEKQTYQLQITAINGELLVDKSLHSDEIVYLPNLENGLYLLTLSLGDGRKHIQKIIVNRH